MSPTAGVSDDVYKMGKWSPFKCTESIKVTTEMGPGTMTELIMKEGRERGKSRFGECCHTPSMSLKTLQETVSL